MSIPNDTKITLKYEEDGLSLAWQMTLIKTFMRLFSGKLAHDFGM